MISPTSLHAALLRSRRVADEFAVVVFTNRGMLNMTLNWLISLDRVGEDVRLPLLICFDAYSHRYLADLGLNVYRVDAETFAEIGLPPVAITTALAEFGSLDYKVVVQTKMYISAYIVKVGVPYIFSDVDIVLLRRRPTNAFGDIVSRLNEASTRNIAMLIQNDDDPARRKALCTGFYILRPTEGVLDLFTRVSAQLNTTTGKGNQAAFNQVCNDMSCRDFVDVLEPSLYMRGADFFFKNTGDRTIVYDNGELEERLPCMVHANFMVGSEKEERMRKLHVWYIEDPKLLQVLAAHSSKHGPVVLPESQ